MSDNGSTRKRRRKDESEKEEEPIKKGVDGIITSLLLLDEEEKHEQVELKRASNDDKMLSDNNHKKKTRAMLDFYSNFQDLNSEVEESKRLTRKELRATAEVVAVAATVSDELEKTKFSGAAYQRRLWVKDQSKAWWDKYNGPDFPDEEFKKAFRMGRATFDLICEELNSVIAKEDITLRNVIPVRQRVAVCLWRLATGDFLRLVSKSFGLGISTCHKLVPEVVGRWI